MAQDIDPAVWETKLRKLMAEYRGHQTLDQGELHILNTLGRLLARDDEVELHPWNYYEYRVKIRHREGQYAPEFGTELMVGAIADVYNLLIANVTVEEVE